MKTFQVSAAITRNLKNAGAGTSKEFAGSDECWRLVRPFRWQVKVDDET
jgi:hypothetical protein